MKKMRMKVFIESGSCWGSIPSEDTGGESCHLCVDLCPEVFEKMRPDACAYVRTSEDTEFDARKVRMAAEKCPVGAIRILDS